MSFSCASPQSNKKRYEFLPFGQATGLDKALVKDQILLNINSMRGHQQVDQYLARDEHGIPKYQQSDSDEEDNNRAKVLLYSEKCENTAEAWIWEIQEEFGWRGLVEEDIEDYIIELSNTHRNSLDSVYFWKAEDILSIDCKWITNW